MARRKRRRNKKVNKVKNKVVSVNRNENENFTPNKNNFTSLGKDFYKKKNLPAVVVDSVNGTNGFDSTATYKFSGNNKGTGYKYVPPKKPDLCKKTFTELTAVGENLRPKLPPVDLQSEDVKLLKEIHSYKRVHESSAEADFIDTYIKTIPGIQCDAEENYYVRIGEKSSVLWSSHIDTVHNEEGYQEVVVTKDDMLVVDHTKENSGNCLGADDGAGMFIMFKMIEAGIPGLYVFHRNEESGADGSRYIASEEGRNAENLLEGIDFAIAFDRKDYDSVITHQYWYRTASDEFAKSFAKVVDIPKMGPDSTGVFTDTENYTSIVSECTNISVGYFRQHGPMESLDLRFIIYLKDQIIKNWDESKLVKKRDPAAKVYARNSRYGGYGGMYNDAYSGIYGDSQADYGNYDSGISKRYKEWWNGKSEDSEFEERDPEVCMAGYEEEEEEICDRNCLEKFCRTFPEVAAKYIDDYGLTVDDLEEMIYEQTGEIISLKNI